MVIIIPLYKKFKCKSVEYILDYVKNSKESKRKDFIEQSEKREKRLKVLENGLILDLR